jgi:hypothetical protein
MADYIRDLRPAKWASMINLRSLSALGLGCSLIPGARSGADAAVLGTSALYGHQFDGARRASKFL